MAPGVRLERHQKSRRHFQKMRFSLKGVGLFVVYTGHFGNVVGARLSRDWLCILARNRTPTLEMSKNMRCH